MLEVLFTFIACVLLVLSFVIGFLYLIGDTE
jgi:hypothetical protein